MTPVAVGFAVVAAIWFALAAVAWTRRDRHRHDFALWERECRDVEVPT